MGSAQDDRIGGALEELKGKAKSAIGNMTDNDDLRAEGDLDQLKGRAQQAVGDIKEKVSDVLDEIEHKIKPADSKN
ncbi:MAG: CsbD family protein [Thermomicrobiales bacterium]